MPPEPKATAIRVFIAICIEEHLLARIEEEQERLRRFVRSEAVRWTDAEQLHLTLTFLGNVTTDRTDALLAALPAAVSGIAPFRLSVCGFGAFPSRQRPSVIWLGLKGDLDQLNRLQGQVDGATRSFASHSEERTYHAHLTIGRIKGSFNDAKRVGRALASVEIGQLGEWEVREITLFRSQLGARGSTYHVLAAAPLIETVG
jgi:2'-5' RNA ligase